ncbi:14267_t:CDS:2 [Acaulospora morrowiae]|uniref:14267_t:CDS:1 n=1 Tax=Acaulospora morrowiae TaxID=94023 RepID=A0A9N8VM24_9GLOM|nr:14267_t:CDS:2 [Acaulospora morrowiae]
MSPISIPHGAVQVIDPYEEVFLLYTEGRPLEWKHNRVVSQKKNYVEVTIDDRTTVNIGQSQSLLSARGTTGSVLWDSSIMLSRLMITNREWLGLSTEKTNVIELGSGCGLTGIALSSHVRLMALTDQASMIPHLWKNVKRNLGNQNSKVIVTELMWGEDIDKDIIRQHWDYVIASDCIFNESINVSFVETLVKLCGGVGGDNSKTTRPASTSDESGREDLQRTVVIIALELRSDEVHSNFLEEMTVKRNFMMWRLPTSMYGSEFEKGYAVYVAWI